MLELEQSHLNMRSEVVERGRSRLNMRQPRLVDLSCVLVAGAEAVLAVELIRLEEVASRMDREEVAHQLNAASLR